LGKKPRAKRGKPAGKASEGIPLQKKVIGQTASTWQPDTGEVGIRVRMYRVGFGDFFLITFLGDQGDPLHAVIDCGVFKGTSQTGDIRSIEAAVENMALETNGRLELVVMTHRHADHIAGFARCAETFRGMTVSDVWMPIWEAEYEPIAVRFQAELERTALGLQKHFVALGASASVQQKWALQYMENATGVVGVAAQGSNANALGLLKHGFGGVTPKYYKANDKPHVPESLVKAGLTCKVLGPPPLDDLKLMKLMDLQKGVGQYITHESGIGTELSAPFSKEWTASPTKKASVEGPAYSAESFREWVSPRESWKPFSANKVAPAQRHMERTLNSSEPIAALVAAKQLDAFLNNQSLVLLFTFKGKRLLFVGDAQAGNWEHWLYKTDSPDKKGTGIIDGTAREILTSLDFYKMGHHGSGNATPKAAIKAMSESGRRFVCMCSTEAGVYGTEHPEDPIKGTEVPRDPLLQEMAAHAALVRSDQFDITVGKDLIKGQVKMPLPKPVAGSRIEKGLLWVDCFL
jgi:hypothetical protein